MFTKMNLFLGALALTLAFGAIASECVREEVRTQRQPPAYVSYSRSAVRAANDESNGVQRATAEDRSYPRRGAMISSGSGPTPSSTYGNGIGRGRKENL